MGRLIAGIGGFAAAALVAAVLASPTSATPSAVDLTACDGASVTVTGTGATLGGPTFRSTNKGIVQDFLNSNTTTFRAGGTTSNANAGWSAPLQSVDPALGTVWSTSWLRTVATPPVGAPLVVGLEVVLAHAIPDLTAPAAQRPAKFAAGLWKSATCTLTTGQIVTAASGGTVATGDGRVSLAVPAGATGGDTTIVVTPSSAVPPTTLGTLVSATYDLGPSGTTFARPATITLAFDSARLPANTGRALHVVAESNGVWSLLPSSVDLARGTVSAPVRHFSLFGVTATPGYQVIGGTVTTDTTATPIANVSVRVRDAAATTSSPPVATATTNAFGEWAALVADGGTYKVRFVTTAPTPYAGEWARNSFSFAGGTSFAVSGADVVVDEGLADGYFASGRVVDASGAPIANAFVAAQLLPGGACCTFVAGAATDAAGAYTLVLPAGSYKLQVSGPQDATYVLRWYPNGATPDQGTFVQVDATTSPVVLGDVTLPTGRRISGTVVLAGTTTPVENVSVSLAQVPATPSACCTFVTGARTGADGTFAMIVEPGRYILQIQKSPPYLARWYDGTAAGTRDVAQALPIDVTAADASGIQFGATLGFRVSGRVSRPDGTAAPQIGIHFPNVNGQGGCGGGCAMTDANGDFDISIEPGTWIVRFDPQPSNQNLGTTFIVQYWNGASSPATATPIVATSGGSLTGVTATLAQGYRISGTVVAAGTTTPLGGVPVGVNVTPSDPNSCCQGLGGMPSLADGSFSFVVGPGSYILGVGGGSSSYVFRWYDGAAGTLDHRFALPITVTAADVGGLQLPTVLGYRISGRVTQPGGAPAPRVGVHAPNPDGSGGCGGGCGATNDNGEFEFAIAPGSWIIRFDPHMTNPLLGTSYVVQYWNGASSPSGATVITAVAGGAQGGLNATLVSGFRISGRVTDATTGAGIGGVNVGAHDPSRPCCNTYVNGAQTDGGGNYSFTVAPGMSVKVGFFPSAPYRVQWWDGAADISSGTAIATSAGGSATANAALTRARMITGRVTVGGVPLAGVNIEALRGTPGSCCEWGLGGAMTEANGSYTLLVNDGAYKIRFSPPQGSRATGQWWNGTAAGSYALSGATDVSANGVDVPNVDAELTLGWLITGTVRGPGGPLANAGVSVAPATCCGDLFASGTSARADGTYQLAVRDGTYKLQFSAPPPSDLLWQFWTGAAGGTRAYDLAANVTVSGADIGPYDAALEQGVHITGRVTSGGSGVGGVQVSAQSARPDGSCCMWESGMATGSDGRYDLLAPARAVKIRFDPGATAYIPAWYGGSESFESATAVTGPAANIDAALVLGLRISGRVTDGVTGAGVANVWLAAHDATLPCCAFRGGGGTDQSGNYTMVVPAGSYKIHFQPQNTGGTAYLSEWWNAASGFETAATVSGAAGAIVSGIDATLETGLVITGTVRGGGVGIANVWIGAEPGGAGAQCCAAVRYSANSGADGAYRLVVRAGTYRIRFNPPATTLWMGAFHSTTDPGTTDFYLASDVTAPASGVDGVLATGRRITGRVTAGGAGVGDVNVSVWRVLPPGVCCGHANGARTAADGSFSVTVPDGTYRVRFDSPAGSHLLGEWNGNVATYDAAPDIVVSGADVGGVNADLATGYWITGRVLAPDGVTPLANAWVNAHPSASCCVHNATATTTDADGVYHLVVTSGTWRVQINPNPAGAALLWQWYSTSAPGTRDFSQGDIVTVAGADVAVGDARIAQGVAITGRVTDGAGAPLVSVNVSAHDATLGCCTWVNGTHTQADGSYYLVVPAGSYKLNADGTAAGHGASWYGGADFATATPVTAPASGVVIVLP